MSVSEPGSSLILCQSALNLFVLSNQINAGVSIVCGWRQICYFLGNDNMNLKLVLAISGYLRLHDPTNSNYLNSNEQLQNWSQISFSHNGFWFCTIVEMNHTALICVQYTTFSPALNVLLITGITARIRSAVTDPCVWTPKRCNLMGSKTHRGLKLDF